MVLATSPAGNGLTGRPTAGRTPDLSTVGDAQHIRAPDDLTPDCLHTTGLRTFVQTIERVQLDEGPLLRVEERHAEAQRVA
jgi:hypothetical protein